MASIICPALLSGFHIVSVSGEFTSDEAVRLLVQEEEGEPREFGRAIVNYASKDCAKMVERCRLTPSSPRLNSAIEAKT